MKKLLLCLLAVGPILSGCEIIADALFESAFGFDDDGSEVVVVEKQYHYVTPPPPVMERSYRGESESFR